MEPRLLIKIMVPVIVLLSLSSLFIKQSILTPVGEVTYYASILMPSLLLLSVVLGIKVAFTYERDLKLAFLFISGYLAVLTLGNLKPFWILIYGWWEYAPLLFDILASSMLLLACIYILRVIETKHMTRGEWAMMGGVFAVCLLVVTYPAILGKIALISIAFRILNVSLVILLLPVLFLYLHQFRGEAKESVTFGMIVVGIIVATIADWIYEIVTRIPHAELGRHFQTGSPYDALLLLAYFTIFLGLFVHINYERWSLQRLKTFKIV
jgi:hypothetical protein